MNLILTKSTAYNEVTEIETEFAEDGSVWHIGRLDYNKMLLSDHEGYLLKEVVEEVNKDTFNILLGEN